MNTLGRHRVVLGSVLVLCLAAGHCAAQPPALPAPPSRKPISTDEGKTFARRIERAMDTGDVRVFNSALDFDALLDRCLQGLTEDERFKAEFKEGLTANNMGRQIFHSLGRTGSYRMVRLHKVAGEPRVLFRHVGQRQGLTYHDLILGRDEHGAVRIVDIYNYRHGQTVSRNMRFLAAMRLSESDGTARDFRRAAPDLEKVTRVQSHGDFRGALLAYNRLPATLKLEKSLLLARLHSAGRLSPGAFARAETHYQRVYPNDPAVDFVKLEMLIRWRQLDDALAVLERIEDQVGGDTYLDLVRAHVYFTCGRRPEGKHALERFLAFEPALREGYYLGIDSALRAQEWGEVVRLMKLSRANADLPWDRVELTPELAEFRESEEYKKWRRDEVRNAHYAGARF